MPDQPTWLPRVPDILSTLQSSNAPSVIDRNAVEKLFGIRRRQAIVLLHRFHGYQLGRTFVVPRESVIEFLRQFDGSEALKRAKAKKQSVEEFLGEARRGLTLPRIPLPAAKLSEITFTGLSQDIHLVPGHLSIQFRSATDLLEKLFSLSQALANDFETLESSLAEGTDGHSR